MIQYPGLERVLMREGEETTFALVLLDGVVKATGTVRDGTQELLAIRVGGDMVGEFAAIDGRPRSATITTCGTVVARAFSRADLRDCMRRDPEIAQAIKVSVVAKLRDAGAHRVGGL
jgi:CRP-like cAMP-binding protein